MNRKQLRQHTCVRPCMSEIQQSTDEFFCILKSLLSRNNHADEVFHLNSFGLKDISNLTFLLCVKDFQHIFAVKQM